MIRLQESYQIEMFTIIPEFSIMNTVLCNADKF